MKRIIALTLVLTLLLCGCGGKADQEEPILTTEPPAEAATEAATEPTTEPTTVPTTEPIVYFDPLNGEILDAPYDGRIFASSVANTLDCLPHVNVQKADIIMEGFVNGSVVRCLALFSNPDDIEAIGSTRSTRLMFNDIAQHYNAILSHAGGSSFCLQDATERGLAHYNVDSLMRQGNVLMQGTAYRDKEHPQIKYGAANLYTILPGVAAYAESQGVQISGMPETDYGLTFVEDGTPASGEDAASITVIITYGKSKKDTTMVYDAEKDKYVWNQYGKEMHDLFTDEPETFQNVVIMYADITDVQYKGTFYHDVDFLAGGTGYYANGGKIIPIKWTCDGDNAPFRYFHEDGTPLSFGQGNTYMAICTPESEVNWIAELPVEETEPTTAG